MSGAGSPGRIGGEDFACLLVDTTEDNARLLAERIRPPVGKRVATQPAKALLFHAPACAVLHYSPGKHR